MKGYRKEVSVVMEGRSFRELLIMDKLIGKMCNHDIDAPNDCDDSTNANKDSDNDDEDGNNNNDSSHDRDDNEA